jgi:hypothetical protein
METIKIGRKEYNIQKGDYILYNGACYQFCTGDNRTLKMEGFNQYTSLTVPASVVKKIPFENMVKQNIKTNSGMNLVRWLF